MRGNGFLADARCRFRDAEDRERKAEIALRHRPGEWRTLARESSEGVTIRRDALRQARGAGLALAEPHQDRAEVVLDLRPRSGAWPGRWPSRASWRTAAASFRCSEPASRSPTTRRACPRLLRIVAWSSERLLRAHSVRTSRYDAMASRQTALPSLRRSPSRVSALARIVLGERPIERNAVTRRIGERPAKCRDRGRQVVVAAGLLADREVEQPIAVEQRAPGIGTECRIEALDQRRHPVGRRTHDRDLVVARRLVHGCGTHNHTPPWRL